MCLACRSVGQTAFSDATARLCIEAPGCGSGAVGARTESVAFRPHVFVAKLVIRLYRYTFSFFMGRTCRYLPTCSEYTEQAIERFGLWAGGWMGLRRILDCHPWSGSGFDPVPEQLPAQARWYMPWRYGPRPKRA